MSHRIAQLIVSTYIERTVCEYVTGARVSSIARFHNSIEMPKLIDENEVARIHTHMETLRIFQLF